MLRRKPFHYREAALIGFIGGALLFPFEQLAVRAQPGDQLQWLLATMAGGVLIACAFVFLWNRAWRRAHQRHNQRRGTSLTDTAPRLNATAKGPWLRFF